MPHSLKKQTVVITGASSGIGLATAEAAARKGAKVVLQYVNKSGHWLDYGYLTTDKHGRYLGRAKVPAHTWRALYAGNTTTALHAIDRARDTLAAPGLVPELPWFDYYDTTRLHGFAGYAMLRAQRYDDARTELSTALGKLSRSAVKQRANKI